LLTVLEPIGKAPSRYEVQLARADAVSKCTDLRPVSQARKRSNEVEGLSVRDGPFFVLQQAAQAPCQQLELRDIPRASKPVHALRAARGKHEWGGSVTASVFVVPFRARAPGDGSV
jgi:hypothetical protein